MCCARANEIIRGTREEERTSSDEKRSDEEEEGVMARRDNKSVELTVGSGVYNGGRGRRVREQ